MRHTIEKICVMHVIMTLICFSKLALVIISGVFGPTGFAVFGSIIADYSVFTLKFSRDDYDIGKNYNNTTKSIRHVFTNSDY